MATRAAVTVEAGGPAAATSEPLLRGDMKAVLETLQRGLASAEHRAFLSP